MNEPNHVDVLTSRASWVRLLGDHDRIARQCTALVAIARRPDCPYGQATVMLLELAVCVADHLGVEDRVIDLTAMALRFGMTPDRVTAMTGELDLLKRDWIDFIGRWTPDTIVARWPLFADDAETMLGRLATQVRRENELLYAEASGMGIIAPGERLLN